MIRITKENSEQAPPLSAANHKLESSDIDSGTSPLTTHLESANKSDVTLAKQGRASCRTAPCRRILNTLKRVWPGSANNEDVEQSVVIFEGARLYQEAEALRDTRSKTEQQQALPLSLKSKTALAMGAAVMLAGAGLFWRQFSQSGRPDHLLPGKTAAEPTSTATDHTPEASGSFSTHDCRYNGEIKIPRHVRRHLANPQPVSKDVSDSEVNKRKLFNFSCQKQRETLSFSNVLRNIADSLSSPIKKFGEEWQVIYNYNLLKKGCPQPSEKVFLLNILHYVDSVSSTILHSFPRFVPLMIIQNIVPPVLRSIADKLDGKKMDFDLIIQINHEFLSVSQMLSASLDLHGINLLSDAQAGLAEGVIPEKLKLKDGGIFVELEGGEYKMCRDRDGVYIHDIEAKSLQLRKNHIDYVRGEKKWRANNRALVMSPDTTSQDYLFEASRKLMARARIESKTTGKYVSSVDFVSTVLNKLGLANSDNLNYFRNSVNQPSFQLTHMEETSTITKLDQLLKVKAGQVVIFIQPKENNMQVKHTMLATGNGLFTGIHNDEISVELGHEGITLTAEQLGEFEGGFLTSSEGKRFHVYAGYVKNSKLPYYKSYKESVLNLEVNDYSAGSAHAIGVVLSMTGDLSPDLVSALHNEIINGGSIRPFIKFVKNREGWFSREDIGDNTPPGGMIFLTQKPSDDYDKGIFALRLEGDSFFIPELFEPALKVGGVSTIYTLKELKNNIKEKELWVKPVEFNLENTRVKSLLGKDARFYAFGEFLRVRAHGAPRNINYRSPTDIVSIIKGLSISKGIDLNKIKTIEIESCFGATGFPSSGRIIAAKTGKKVVAWRGKYRTDYDSEDEAKVIYHPTPLSHLENISEEITDRHTNFFNKLRGLYIYLSHTIKESTLFSPHREKRSSQYFNLLLIDLGRLVLGKIDTETFIKDNKFIFGSRIGDIELIRDRILRYVPEDSMAFSELCLEILYVSPEATEYLDNYISRPLNDEYSFLSLAPVTPQESRNNVSFNRNITSTELLDLAYAMGISTENMFLTPKKWHEFGFPGDIYVNKDGNKFFEFRREGIPANHFWRYPVDAMDNENWLYAGRNPGTVQQPKDWYEYGKAGSVYYDTNRGYFALKTDGRPSDHQWYFPSENQNDEHWEFITLQAGTFRTPRAWNDNGVSGDVYFSVESDSYYILKKEGKPPSHGWHFPAGKRDDANWINAGINLGTRDRPKQWNEYGIAGSIYHHPGSGYMSLKLDGRPSDNNWFLPHGGESDEHWNFICFEVGSFDSPKLPNVEGTAGEVYYDYKKHSYFILRMDGKPASRGWPFPAGKTDDSYWIYGGQNSGTLESPKSWNEYGKPGSIYHHPGHGYFSLNHEGRPSENKWKFPHGGRSNKRWKLVSWEQGSFNAPKLHDMQGKSGEVYYSEKFQSFYILKASGNPSLQGWFFPSDEEDDENWIYAGKNPGTLEAPKSWDEYGRAGSIYLQAGYGYFALKTEGRPSEIRWKYPTGGQSDKHWKFISWDLGSFNAPKRLNVQGKVGEVYFSDENASFYILRKNMTSLTKGWHFPSSNTDDESWFYAGKNSGTLNSPKAWNEYGKAGSIYYQSGYGYLILKKEGRPPDEKWYFPHKRMSNNYWKFISMRAASFNNPKRQNDEGMIGEVYYSDMNHSFYILKNAGNPSTQGWRFPSDGLDDANWICAGENRGTPDSPKDWEEYGKTGSVYYDAEFGYLTLKMEGRPAEHNWHYPIEGDSNERWNFISWEMGSFDAPKHLTDKGTVGEIYYNDKNKLFYAIKKEGTPATNGWFFPRAKADNAHWIYTGDNRGTLHSPKTWGEYGKQGAVYYSFKYGYLTLQTEGRPSDRRWYYPLNGQSDKHWKFISWEAGSWVSPKRQSDEGVAGEVYYSDENQSFYILKKTGNPASRGWHFPAEKADGIDWIYGGENKGTLYSPKQWTEYGKVGSIYYQAEYGFLTLKTEGRPPDNQWLFPNAGESDDHWSFISFEAGTYKDPKQATDKGVAGEVYYSFSQELYYILRKEGVPSQSGWSFPSGKQDNWYWLYGGDNKGTMAYPKHWGEYGKVNSIYYKNGYGYFVLRTEGNPSVNKWYFPQTGESNTHWRYLSQ